MKELIACHECDLLLPYTALPPGTKACCPRCGYQLYSARHNSLERTLALNITGLLLYIPAMFLPIMSLEMLGQSQFDTVFAGIATLFAHDIWWAALLVLFCSMLAPLFKKLLLLYVLLGIKCAWSKPPLARAFSWYQHLDSWAMLEVYMLGVLVSVVKLIDLAAIQFGLGLVCFIALMICSMATGVVLDHHLIWHKLEQFPNQPKAAG